MAAFLLLLLITVATVVIVTRHSEKPLSKFRLCTFLSNCADRQTSQVYYGPCRSLVFRYQFQVVHAVCHRHVLSVLYIICASGFTAVKSVVASFFRLTQDVYYVRI